MGYWPFRCTERKFGIFYYPYNKYLWNGSIAGITRFQETFLKLFLMDILNLLLLFSCKTLSSITVNVNIILNPL